MWRSSPRTVGLLVAAALVLAGCGDDGDTEVDADTGGESQEQPTVAPPTTPADAATEPTPAGTTTPAEAEERVYQVQQGDTLWDIAAEHGTTVEAIAEANGIDDPSTIHPGDELVIPAE